jgi:uncharacterized protein YndB with AHSA1/START domain
MIAFAQPMSCVTRDIVLPVDRDRAWELITDESELREWLADEVEFAPLEGAPVRADDREGVVEEVEPAERIVFTWGDSIVEWRLDDAPGGTRFVVTEYRTAADAWGPRLEALAGASLLCPA